jgi:hypothetical protein
MVLNQRTGSQEVRKGILEALEVLLQNAVKRSKIFL